MTAVQLDIFSGAAIAATTDTQVKHGEWLMKTQVVDPCKFCEFRGLCPDDDCGALGFPIDVPTPDFMSESDYMAALRRNGLSNI